MNQLTYKQARWIVLGFGSALIAAVALSAFLRGADPVEVVAIVLFLPVLVALAFWRSKGGVAAAIVMSLVYIVLRFTTLPEGLEASEFVGSVLVRVLLYVGLGLFGGWANEMLEHALHKLELYDEIDDLTGVGNARAFLALTDREAARARRYNTIFSVGVIEIDRPLFASMGEREAGRTLRRFAQTLESSVRTTDAVIRVPFEEREDLAVILPETGEQGASVFTENLLRRAREEFRGEGLPAENGLLRVRHLTLPGDDEELTAYEADVRAVYAAMTVKTEEGEA